MDCGTSAMKIIYERTFIMRHSRIRIGNELVELGFDSYTGELLELIDVMSGENLIKNWCEEKTAPFFVELSHKDGRKEKLDIPKYNFLLSYEAYKPRINITGLESGGKRLEVFYNVLMSRDGIRKVEVKYSVEVYPGCSETFWRISVRNLEAYTIIKSVMFPCIYGVYLGETWKDDTLVYPFNAGEKTENPVSAYENEPAQIGWKWQEYKYIYHLNGIGTKKEGDGSYVREFKYSGPVSMMWLDYYDSEKGLYMASYDDSFQVSGLHAETFGEKRPGMGFYITKHPETGTGHEWDSAAAVVAVHKGDWHWGADRYRAWREACRPVAAQYVPEWFEKSAGLMAHYDFKYQDGEVVHRFSDIPKLYDLAREFGLNHLLISGWHRDGFDNGFPMYEPDTDMGSREEFEANVQKVRKDGCHVSFYINSQLFNTRYTGLEELRQGSGVMGEDGRVAADSYGDKAISFSVMCCQAEPWRKHLRSAADYLLDNAGADGLYIDQLGMARPQFCYNPSHGHHPSSWNQGYGRLLDEINSEHNGENPYAALIYEGVSDIHGSKVSGQLISTFFYYHSGAFPEMYKYTFPEQTLVDMVYPSKNQVMRPVHVSQVSREMINKAFITGSYFWIYDLEEDNTFTSDPEQLEYLKSVLKLRKLWLESFGKGIFKDTVGLLFDENAISAKKFEISSTMTLIAVWNRKGMPTVIRFENQIASNKKYCRYDLNAEYAVEAGDADVIFDVSGECTAVKTGTSELLLIVLYEAE